MRRPPKSSTSGETLGAMLEALAERRRVLIGNMEHDAGSLEHRRLARETVEHLEGCLPLGIEEAYRRLFGDDHPWYTIPVQNPVLPPRARKGGSPHVPSPNQRQLIRTALESFRPLVQKLVPAKGEAPSHPSAGEWEFAAEMVCHVARIFGDRHAGNRSERAWKARIKKAIVARGPGAGAKRGAIDRKRIAREALSRCIDRYRSGTWLEQSAKAATRPPPPPRTRS